MKKVKFFIVICFIYFIGYLHLFGQPYKSVHQLDYEKFSNLPNQKSLFDESGKGIIPIKNLNKGLTKIIYGYLPDWLYQPGKAYLNYNLLTHISAFDFIVNSTGNITFPSYWPWTDVINEAHNKGVKVILTAVCFNATDIHNLLTNSTAKQNLFNNLKNTITQYQLDGVNVDFESMATADRGDLLNGFMLDLTNFIHNNLPGKEVSFAGPAVNWGGWNLYGLANSCDYIFIMGYDFYGSWSTTSGPSSPLTGGNYNITNTVNVQYSSVTQNMPQKLVLGVPYYGNRWNTQTLDPYSAAISHIGSVAYKDAIAESGGYGLLWSSNQTVWYRYFSNGLNYQVWFDSDSSLGLKYQLAQTKNFRGVGMWALGYDAGRTELWNELKKRFFVQGNVNLVFPNGGESFVAGNVCLIKWSESNSTRIKLEYTTNNGTGWSIISSSYPSDSNKFNWTIPNASSSNCKIKITDLNSDNVYDLSDSVFTIVPNKPNIPSPLNPSNNAKFLNLNFSYMWNKPEGSQLFHLQVASDTNFSNLFVNDSILTETIKYVPGHTDGSVYYWRLAASNIAGKSAFSNYFKLSTKLLEPDSLNANFIENKIKLNWIENSKTSEKIVIQRKINGSNIFENIDTIQAGLKQYSDTNIMSATSYIYRLFAFNSQMISLFSKEFMISTNNITNNENINDKYFLLKQNFPNPFNGNTIINYFLKAASKIKLSLLNSLGQEIKLLKDCFEEKGFYEYRLNSNDISSGIYFIKLEYIEKSIIQNQTIKIILMK